MAHTTAYFPPTSNSIASAAPDATKSDSSHYRALRTILERLSNAHQCRSGWTALCPAHDDRRNSLSIALGSNGQVLLHCFASCTVEAIVAAVGLRVSDLFADSAPCPATNGAIRRPRVRPSHPPPPGALLEQLRIARDVLSINASAAWVQMLLATYHTNSAALVAFEGGVLPPWQDRPARIATPMFKAQGAVCGLKIRPGFYSKSDDTAGSRTGLFGATMLVALPDARVLAAEGDHDALALKAAFPNYVVVGFPGVTRWPDDASMALRGRDVTLIPHLDVEGRAACARIATALRHVAAAVRIVDLHQVFEGGAR